MNYNRHVLQNKEVNIKENKTNIYIGNKLIKLHHKDSSNSPSPYEYDYYDISLLKELFLLIDGKIQSLSDFSNFQRFHKPIETEDKNLIIQPYKELTLFKDLELNEYYTTHLQELWKFIEPDSSIEEILTFMEQYNKKISKKAIPIINSEQLQILDWWYVQPELQTKEDFIDIISTDDKQLLGTLSTLKGPVKRYQKTLFGNYK